MEIPPKKKLLNQVRDAIRLKHYSYRTLREKLHWAGGRVRYGHELRN